MSTREHRKRRRRRRRPHRSPIAARLVLDDTGRGDCGSIAQDLVTDLFGYDPTLDGLQDARDDVRYIAVCPWSPPAKNLEEYTSWTILPVKVHELPGEGVNESVPSSIRFPASSFALQTLAEALQATRINPKGKPGIEVLVLDVQPLLLDIVFVKVDGEALRKHNEVQKRFGGGFMAKQPNGYMTKGKGKAAQGDRAGSQLDAVPNLREDGVLAAAVRGSLASPMVIHRGDLIPLPLPSHPITHVPFPPIEITACEPVDQGIISRQTQIIIDLVYHDERLDRRLVPYSKREAIRNPPLEEEDDISNEQFYSAVESGTRSPSTEENDIGLGSQNSDSSDTEQGSLSDDSMDNMISLSSPGLPSQMSGAMSSMTAATPKAGMPKPNGVNTPGSVFSSYTATTARQGHAFEGKSFEARALLNSISDDLLHPKPNNDEDDEARVFVDIKMLARLGCFSGDWVRIFPSQEPHEGHGGSWGVGAFGDEEATSDEFRAVKIYGSSYLSVPGHRHHGKSWIKETRSSAGAGPIRRPTAAAYLSPLLLANLGQPTHVKLAALPTISHPGTRSKAVRVSSSSIPPIAKEMTLLRIPTPLSTERSVQAALLARLKQYFEHKRRILKQGDLLGITLDVGVSRTLTQTSATDDEDEISELINNSHMRNETKSEAIGVAWFRVGQILVSDSKEDISSLEKEIWGGAASIEPLVTRMVQVGSEQSRVPPTLQTPWNYYFGLRQLPRSYANINPILSSVGAPPKLFVTPQRRRVRELLAATTSPRAIHLDMKPVVILLQSTQRGIGKAYLASCACADIGLHVFIVDAYDILTEGGAGGGDIKTEASLKAKVERAVSCGSEHTVLLIRHAEALTADRMASALQEVVGNMRALIATTTEVGKVPEQIRGLFTHEIEILAPDEGEREGILRGIIQERGIRMAPDVDFSAIAVKTAALVAGDLVDVVDRALVARQERMELLLSKRQSTGVVPEAPLVRDVLVSGGIGACCVTRSDMDIAVDAARKNFADAIGAPKIPNVSWDDVGGLTNVKDAVMETIQLPLERPELFAKGMKKRSGILFYGPPGTGKTLLAKAIATEFSLNFFSVKGPELLNMYIGESEANVRRVFQRARDARPCVVFFDELDSVAPKRGNQGDSGGVMDRIVSQLLAELDGMSDGDGHGGGVFVIGATNRPDLLDQALLRPGRFDKMLYLGVSDTHDKQLTILEALTRKFTLHPAMSLRRVAESLPFTYTGADLYALCSDAMLKAITRQASAVDAKIKSLPGTPVTTAYFFDHLATEEDMAVMVTEEDFLAAQEELVGSVR